MNLSGFLRNQEGITLIALVITIIILLILAGVSIAMLTGENGILNKANDSVLQTEIAGVAEQLNLINYENRIGKEVNGTAEDILTYLKRSGIINDQNVIDTEKLLETSTRFGNGETTDIFKLQGDEVVYINSNGDITARKKVGITVSEENTPSYTEKDFVTTWKVEAGDELILPISLSEGSSNFVVDWGDGTNKETINNENQDLADYPRHQYKEAGEYDIIISGKCSYFTTYQFEDENPGQEEKLIKLKSWGEIEAERYEFTSCTNLGGSIPSPSENTFMNFEDDMEYLFLNCKSITSIPEDLFSNIPDDITIFKDTFNGCESLTNIPENLFANAVNAESFEGIFDGCIGLTSIPENLFANNLKVTTFKEVFRKCEGLTSIPEKLFANNPEVTSFEKAFYRCLNIQSIPDKIFDNNQKVTNFEFTFYGLDEITTAPALWQRTGVDGTSCFGSCDNLDSEGLGMPAIWYARE